MNYDKAVKIVERALENIDKRGADDIFQPPLFSKQIEVRFINDPILRKHILNESVDYLRKLRLQSFGEIKKFSVPKTPYSFRQVCWIDITDLVKYTSLVLTMADAIEASRVDIKRNIVVSHRMLDDGPFFHDQYDYKTFRQVSASWSKNANYKVKIATDISNFYDRLNLHRLESVLASMGCQHKYVKAINDLLLFWAGRNSYGLPVGCDASRYLAEAALSDVDQELCRRNVTFVRYVDDYRIFSKTYADAHSHLNLLIELLDREGLFINTSKTIFFDLDDQDNEDNTEERSIPPIFEKIDENEKAEHWKVKKVGYVTKITRYFRPVGQEKISDLQQQDLTALCEKAMRSTPEALEANMKLFVQAFIYQGGSRAVTAHLGGSCSSW